MLLRIIFQNQLRQAASPYARPTSGTAQAKPPITQKYEDLVNVIEELGKDVRPTYAGSKRFVSIENFQSCEILSQNFSFKLQSRVRNF